MKMFVIVIHALYLKHGQSVNKSFFICNRQQNVHNTIQLTKEISSYPSF